MGSAAEARGAARAPAPALWRAPLGCPVRPPPSALLAHAPLLPPADPHRPSAEARCRCSVDPCSCGAPPVSSGTAPVSHLCRLTWETSATMCDLLQIKEWRQTY
ncbi:hypothetical protein STCU_10647 [Strigomonas culicis]|uniref:Uncharacterized protein n=1 Tax=Strigomonas culicis TaxID=28005 RepID=S9TH49_9TRYP|nr:hypothetical protein STCU_10647 [Strigomonas culicis]|eukprot:EPY17397.1 hypothetical protein STCU_10647 [Strigomonas culicis]